MKELCGVILAAGQGTRMRSALGKVLHPLFGAPMITYVVDLCQRLGLKRTLVVVGHQAEKVQEVLATSPVELVHQADQRGTAHAVQQAARALPGFDGDLLVLAGDTPLLRVETVRGLIEAHRASGAAATFLTAHLDRPGGYGRVLRSADGGFRGIVEEAEATEAERQISEVNAGIYCFAARPLFAALEAVPASAVKGELYLPEVLRIFPARGLAVQARPAPDPEEILGINTRADLARAHDGLRRRTLEALMAGGVTVLDPASVHVAPAACIGRDTVLYPNVVIEGRTTIGEGCTIYPGCRLSDAQVGAAVTILDGCVILESEVADGCTLGPYAHLRPLSRLRRRAKVGNFVEVKKATIGEGSKVPHLTYIGDATMGDRVNIGAGTITCNYDGFAKHQTIIEDGAFVGSNTSLVAPVRVGAGAIVAAGSTITEDVPPDAVAFGRAQQVNKPGRAAGIRKKRKAMAEGEGPGPAGAGSSGA